MGGVVGFMGGVDGGVVVCIGVDGCIGCIGCIAADCIGVDGCIGVVDVGVGCIGVVGVAVGCIGCTRADSEVADPEDSDSEVAVTKDAVTGPVTGPDTKPDTGATPSSILPHAGSGSSASVIVAGPNISGPNESLLPGSIPASPYRDSSRGSVRGTFVGVLSAARTPPSARWSSSDSVTSPRYAS